MPDAEATTANASIDAGFDRVLEGNAPDVIATAHALRAAVKAAMPDVVEQVDFGNGLLAFGRSMAMRDLLFAIIPHRAHVNLQLADGVDLPDPNGLIEGTGKRIRHVKVRSAEAAASPAIREIVNAQIEQRKKSR